jgi:alpha-D-xyloside xylohydrolase
MLMQKMMTDIYRQRNIRTYGLVRAGNAGMSMLSPSSSTTITTTIGIISPLSSTARFIGVLWTPEVRSSSTAEEWLRRMQTVCFAPIAMLDAWSDGTKPWTFPEVAEGCAGYRSSCVFS